MGMWGLDSLADLLRRYSVEAEWVLVWFPIRAGAGIDAARMRGGRFRHRNTDAPFSAGNRQAYMIGQGGGGANGDPLAVANAVHAFITIGVNDDLLFEVDLEAVMGRTRRRQRLVLRPDMRTPFMINVAAAGDERIVQGTAVTFHGVFSTSPRAGLARIVSRLLGP
jgi:hypothetical protein